MLRTTWRLLAAIPALLALSASVGACGGHPAATETHGGSLRLALVGRPATVDPLRVSDASGVALDSLIYDGLVRVAPNLEPKPDLARSWKVSGDGQTYTFHLDPRARWQDGQRVTAADVAFSLAAYRAPADGSALEQLLTLVRRIVVHGPSTVAIELRRPYAPFLAQIASLPILPRHLLEQAGYGPRLLAQPALTTQAVGSGPFRLVRLTASGALLKANRRYFLGRPRLDELHISFQPSATAALLLVRHGKADYAPVPDLDAKAVSTWPGVRERHAVALQFASLVWNVDLPPFSSPALRRAMYFAIDRTQIISAALGGEGSLSDGPVPPSCWAYDPKLGHRPFDPAKALSLLRALGWRRVHGILRDAKGTPLRLTILTAGGVPARTVALGLVVRDLTAIGVLVTVRDESFARFLNDYIAGQFQAAFVERGITADPDVTAYFGSPRINGSGENAGNYQDGAVDSALVAQRAARVQSERSTAIRRMQQAMATDPPALFLYFPYDVVALSRHFEGFALDATGAFWNPQDWQRGA
jgi:peptide/nickel transport system substrate-binding protein